MSNKQFETTYKASKNSKTSVSQQKRSAPSLIDNREHTTQFTSLIQRKLSQVDAFALYQYYLKHYGNVIDFSDWAPYHRNIVLANDDLVEAQSDVDRQIALLQQNDGEDYDSEDYDEGDGDYDEDDQGSYGVQGNYDEDDYDDYEEDDYDDTYDRYYDGGKKAGSSSSGGGPGTSKRQGSKSQRDKWYGDFVGNEDAKEWWHRIGKRQNGGNDIENAEQAKKFYAQYLASKR